MIRLSALLGCDIVAPSDMMDGRVGCIANILNKHGIRNKVCLNLLLPCSKYSLTTIDCQK